jgi:hypothetical protein
VPATSEWEPPHAFGEDDLPVFPLDVLPRGSGAGPARWGTHCKSRLTSRRFSGSAPYRSRSQSDSRWNPTTVGTNRWTCTRSSRSLPARASRQHSAGRLRRSASTSANERRRCAHRSL